MSERVIPAPPAPATLAGDFRCGILHPAEIKASSKVRRVGPLVASTPDGKGLIINRKLFHATRRKAFAAYLRNRSDALLCQHFVKKMNYICNPQPRRPDYLPIRWFHAATHFPILYSRRIIQP